MSSETESKFQERLQKLPPESREIVEIAIQHQSALMSDLRADLQPLLELYAGTNFVARIITRGFPWVIGVIIGTWAIIDHFKKPY